MSLTSKEKIAVKEAIANSLRNKFLKYSPQKKIEMPFHTRLLGKNRLALFSFIHSLNTTFGTAIYEPVAETLAKNKFKKVERGHKVPEVISSDAEKVILDITKSLQRSESVACQKWELEEIRKVCRKGKETKIKNRRADIYFRDKDNWHYLIDIKTAKPNIDGFEKYKETLLKWTASILYEDPKANVCAMLAIPYNPNAPQEYKHWTIGNMLEKGTQIKVADQFWDFLAGKPVYDELLDCFEEVGMELHQEIDTYFKQFNRPKTEKKP